MLKHTYKEASLTHNKPMECTLKLYIYTHPHTDTPTHMHTHTDTRTPPPTHTHAPKVVAASVAASVAFVAGALLNR